MQLGRLQELHIGQFLVRRSTIGLNWSTICLNWSTIRIRQFIGRLRSEEEISENGGFQECDLAQEKTINEGTACNS